MNFPDMNDIWLVFQSEKTSRNLALKALNRLNASGARTVGVAFSRVGHKKLTHYYQEDYYGYYGHYYGRDEKTKKSDKRNTK